MPDNKPIPEPDIVHQRAYFLLEAVRAAYLTLESIHKRTEGGLHPDDLRAMSRCSAELFLCDPEFQRSVFNAEKEKFAKELEDEKKRPPSLLQQAIKPWPSRKP